MHSFYKSKLGRVSCRLTYHIGYLQSYFKLFLGRYNRFKTKIWPTCRNINRFKSDSILSGLDIVSHCCVYDHCSFSKPWFIQYRVLILKLSVQHHGMINSDTIELWLPLPAITPVWDKSWIPVGNLPRLELSDKITGVPETTRRHWKFLSWMERLCQGFWRSRSRILAWYVE